MPESRGGQAWKSRKSPGENEEEKEAEETTTTLIAATHSASSEKETKSPPEIFVDEPSKSSEIRHQSGFEKGLPPPQQDNGAVGLATTGSESALAGSKATEGNKVHALLAKDELHVAAPLPVVQNPASLLVRLSESHDRREAMRPRLAD